MACVAHVCLMVDDIDATWPTCWRPAPTSRARSATSPWAMPRAARAAYLRDPNGIIIELVEMPSATTKM